ncbi:MAG: SNF2-related protein, partial [Bacteriovoracaceae bacterium]
DWFELHPEVFLKGKKVDSAEDLVFHGQQCVEHNGQFYFIPQKTLPKIKWLDYFWKKLAAKGEKKQFSWESKIEQIPKSQTLELLAMQEAGLPVEGGPRWQEILAEFKKLKSGNTREDLFAQKDFKVPLKNFQKTGTQWMLDLYKMGLGGILADDMGLGKTIQSIGALEWLRLNAKMGHCLVVVPTSLTYNWMTEIERFAPDMAFYNFASKKKTEHLQFLKDNQHSLTVITYGLFNKNCRELQDAVEWNIVLFDEAQNLKNITATRTGYARKFPAASKFALTGTPMENHYGEFYSLVDLVVPGALGSYSGFLKTYNFQASKGYHPEKLEQELEYLKLKTAPLVMRRNKEKVLLELPDKVETTIKLDFDVKQE